MNARGLLPNKEVIRQFCRFGLVGGLATAVHVATYAASIEAAGIAPLPANFLAYAVAVPVSFFGHFHWTFRQGSRRPWAALASAQFLRFLATTLFGLLLNTLFVHLVTGVMRLDYLFTIPLIGLATPMATFLINRCWVFSAPRRA